MQVNKQIKVSLSEEEKNALINARDILFALYENFDYYEESNIADKCEYLCDSLEQLFDLLNSCGTDIEY